MQSDRDITLQDHGMLVVYLLKKGLPYGTDRGKSVFNIPLPYIVYGPHEAPPPRWHNGVQYYSALPQQCPDFGTVTVVSDIAYPFGCLEPLHIRDMSPATVLPGKSYTVVIQAHPLIQLYLVVLGTPSGTIVTPGFGILGLDPDPESYTYLRPEPGWDGEWSIGVNMSFSATIVQLALEYVPLENYPGPIAYSKINFMIEAASGTGTWPSAGEEDRSPATLPEAEARSFLVERRCSPYRTITLDGEPLPPQ
jgi:hypothetical protein